MSDFDDNNRGAIWPNQKKETDKHPDFTGQGQIDNAEYWISAWKRRQGDNPKGPSLRFSFQKKDAPPPAQDSVAVVDEPFNDDIPF